MATQPAPAARVARAAATDPAAWRAYHLFYHADRERLVAEMVRPTVAALRESGDITRFYFVLYNLGGPHVRLRLKPARGRAARVEAQVERAAAAFFERFPSTTSLPEDAIVRQNAGIVASDPLAGGAADEVYPDNSVRELPAFFEVERYGGPRLFRHSLDYFVLSSGEALRFAGGEGRTSGQRLAAAGRLCVDQAWGLARDATEFSELLGYASRLFTGEWTAHFLRRGDEAFDRQRAVHTRLLRNELDALVQGDGAAEATASPALVAGARRLARGIRRAEDGARWIIAASQLHMTANRLGLLNPEELYLSQILSRAVQELSTADPDFWRDVWERHPHRA